MGGIASWIYPFALVVLMALLLATNRQVSRWYDTGTLFSWAIRVTEPNAISYDTLGAYHGQQGHKTEAIRCLRLAVRYGPTPQQCAHLALTLLDCGELGEAQHWAEVARDAKPDEPAAWLALSGVANKRRKFPEETRLLRHCLTLEPDRAEHWGRLGDALANQGQWREAVAAWQHALALNPTLDRARNNLTRFARRTDEAPRSPGVGSLFEQTPP